MQGRGGGRCIGIVAADTTGDHLGAHLMRALETRFRNLRFVTIGGPAMEAAGAEIVFPLDDLGADDARLSKIRKRFRSELTRQDPALFIGIDAPAFNLDLAYDLKASGIPTVEYVTPAILNWPREHILQVRRAVSLMLTVLPLEARVYEDARVPVTYVGHPFADLLTEVPPMQSVRSELRIMGDAPVVALMTGASAGEVALMGELFIRASAKFAERVPRARFLAPLETRATKIQFETVLSQVSPELDITMMIGHSLDAMAAADVVLVGSGAATLEAALLKRPMVIAHRARKQPWWRFARRTAPSVIGLPNLLAGERIVPEFQQEEAAPENLADALYTLMSDDAALAKADEHFEKIRVALRQNNAEKAAQAIRPLLSAGR